LSQNGYGALRDGERDVAVFISGKPRHEVFRWEMRKALDSVRARVLALEDERAGSMVEPFWMFGIVTSRFGKIVCI